MTDLRDADLRMGMADIYLKNAKWNNCKLDDIQR
jgi:hypothetical protein